jgi:peptide/nickel transport system substrate-binding protein
MPSNQTGKRGAKALLFVIGLVLVSVAAISCAPAPPPATSAPVAPAATSAPAPTTAPAATSAPVASARGTCGTLKLLWWQAPTILNPHLAQGTKDFDASRMVYEPLAAYDPNGNPTAQYGLAEQVPTAQNGGVSADGKTITWKLKKNVKWSDGTLFTADDVIFTWKYATDKATAAATATNFADIDTIDKIDDTTIKVTLKNPSPTPYASFAGPNGLIIQKKAFEDYMGAKAKDAPANLKPVGTGPFMVVDFKPGDVVTYKANPNYRDPNKPCFSDVTLKGGGDATSAARASLQTGDVDYAWNLQVTADVLQQLAQGGKGELITAPSNSVERLHLNMTNADPALGDKRSEPNQPNPFLSDIKVRQALSLGIDRKAIEQLYGGPNVTGGATCDIITAPPPMVSTTKFDFCDYDLAKANALLDSAGWAKGADGIRHKTVNGVDVKAHLLFQTSVNPVRQKTQQIIKQSWEQLGISVELKSVDASVFFSSGPASPDNIGHFYADVEEFANSPAPPGDINFVRGWTCSAIGTKDKEWRGTNYSRWCDKNFDALVDQLASALDPTKRIQLEQQANDAIVSGLSVIPIIARNFPVAGKSKTLKGVVANPWESDLWNVADWTNQ